MTGEKLSSYKYTKGRSQRKRVQSLQRNRPSVSSREGICSCPPEPNTGETTCCVWADGNYSDWFEIASGVRQGCILALKALMKPMDMHSSIQLTNGHSESYWKKSSLALTMQMTLHLKPYV